MWAYHIHDPQGTLSKLQDQTSLSLKRRDLCHHWTTGIRSSNNGSSHQQTKDMFRQYEAYLTRHSITILNDVVRTWIFVRDIDSEYRGMVDARAELFTRRGLTPDTHFIASTGIAGASVDPQAIVSMDAYAISGLQPEQVQHLNALDHLSPTHVYGVTFERGTSIAYRDRKHVIISGTASIDHRGHIVHAGRVSRQLERALQNISALLDEAHATFDDMAVFIAYVRDPKDLETIQQQMLERFPTTPIEVVVAPVCRPNWLVEVEGMAIVPASNPDLPAF